MKNTFTVHDMEEQKYTGKKGEVRQQVYILLDASTGGSRLKQMCEFNAPEDTPQIPIGGRVELEITEIQSIFSGRPRLLGKIASAPKTLPVAK